MNALPIQEGSGQGDFYVVGVGTSAGGLDPLTQLVSTVNGNSPNLCLIIVQHLSPTHKSELTSILERHSKWPVVTALDQTPVRPKTIYVTPQNKTILYRDGHLHLDDLPATHTHAPSIDNFFVSLAKHEKQRAIGIILSGSGQDGARGIQAIKEQGGFTVAQVPDSAQWSSMPIAAIATKAVDKVLPVNQMLEDIYGYIKNHIVVHKSKEHPKSIDAIFELLAKRSGVDFSNYKPATIMRRLQKRINALRLLSITDYYRYIRQNPV